MDIEEKSTTVKSFYGCCGIVTTVKEVIAKRYTKKDYRYIGYEATCWECLGNMATNNEDLQNIHKSLTIMCRVQGVKVAKNTLVFENNMAELIEEAFVDPEKMQDTPLEVPLRKSLTKGMAKKKRGPPKRLGSR